MARTLWENPPMCDFYENRHTDRSLHADQKSQWPQSRRTHRLTYRGHQRYTFVIFIIFGDLCRSNGGSYDFGAIETFDQHAKIYQYGNFHKNRSDFSFLKPSLCVTPGKTHGISNGRHTLGKK